ncbi:MAG: hypothetical protein KF718_19075 [Polyangiaceae bacterium]|nr:hypothetical protein [Polyangiaceae bacterium]
MTDRAAALAVLSGLLERSHGVGLRGGSWVTARLERALDELSAEAGGVDDALALLRSSPERLSALADVLRVGETRFFRDPAHWDALASRAEPWLAQGRLRALSVGCSSGEETWTLAMILARAAGHTSAARVVGTDRSERAIATAARGEYPASAAEHLPPPLRERYLARSEDGARVRVVDPLRQLVTFQVRDALAGPPPGRWELVLCKNVLIYFGDDAAERVVSGLLRALADDGVLLVARSEVSRVRALGHASEELAPGVTVFRAR